MMRVGFVLREDLPRDDGQRARRRDGGHLQAALRTDSMEEGAQRAWRLRRRPGGLDQHCARVRAAAFVLWPCRAGCSPLGYTRGFNPT